MFTSLLVIAAVGGGLFAVNRWQNLMPGKRGQLSKKALIYGGVLIVLTLVLLGKAHWLMGVLAALLALLGRVAQFAQYAPLFKKLMGEEGSQQQTTGSVVGAEMSSHDAADILGVDSNANAEEIKSAHKRLMQKMHPDRGGSDALAKQINLAKDILLKS